MTAAQWTKAHRTAPGLLCRAYTVAPKQDDRAGVYHKSGSNTPMPISRRSLIQTRRRFLAEGAAVAAGLSLDAPAQQTGQALPWYRRAYRWGQTNITEKDPVRYDIEWWRG